MNKLIPMVTVLTAAIAAPIAHAVSAPMPNPNAPLISCGDIKQGQTCTLPKVGQGIVHYTYTGKAGDEVKFTCQLQGANSPIASVWGGKGFSRYAFPGTFINTTESQPFVWMMAGDEVGNIKIALWKGGDNVKIGCIED